MDSNTSNTNNEQYCKGCERYLTPSLFITNGRSLRTCSICRLQSKTNYQRKQQLKTTDQILVIEFDDLSDFISVIFDTFENTANNEREPKNKENEENSVFKFSCTVNIDTLEGDSKERADNIIKAISDVDEYIWIYNHKYNAKKLKSTTFYYDCSQRDLLKQDPKKHSDCYKHRDRQQMYRYSCEGHIKISIYEDLADIEMQHILHPTRANVSITPEIKLFISENIDLFPREIYKRLVERGLDLNVRQKQIHFWWAEIGQNRYKRDENPFLSAQKWLEENSYQIIFQKNSPSALGFLTELWNVLQNSQFEIHEIGIDATYNTNNLRFELYAVLAEIDGAGFPLAYLFIENNGNCGNGIRTGIIIDFLLQLKMRKLEPKFFLSDKDFAQISAARFVWKDIKVQLCLWHIKKAVEARLSSNKTPQQINYNGVVAQQQFSFIDPSFKPNLTKEKVIFCPKELRPLVWKLMSKHLHQHPLVPTIDGQFLSAKSIWAMAVEEVYNFCKQHFLPWLWIYLWNEWYNANRWFLWFRAGCDDNVSIFKTNMFVEAHWKVIKRDFLYKFFRPRLDLVVFVIMEQVVLHSQRKFEQLFVVKREKADWRKTFKREWKELSKQTLNNTYPTDINNWTCGCPAFLISRFFICKHLVQEKGVVDLQFFDEVRRHHQCPFLSILSMPIIRVSTITSEAFEGNNSFEDNDSQACEELYERLIDATEKILEILKDQRSKRNLKWAKGIEKNFIPIEKMLSEITLYKRRRTMPRTFKDHSYNTLFLN